MKCGTAILTLFAFLVLSPAFGTAGGEGMWWEKGKWEPYAIELERGWRPAGSELLDDISGHHFLVEGLFKMPGAFNPQEMARVYEKIRKRDFSDIHDEFDARYEAFRYALACWVYSTNDPNTERFFKRRYFEFQDVCRKLDRKHAFRDREQEMKARWVVDPFAVYSEYLRAYLNEDAHQLETRENPTRPFTMAERYLYYPNEGATKLLRNAYMLVDRYFAREDAVDAWTWDLYINQTKFQWARKTLYVREWEDYLELYEHYRNLKDKGLGRRAALREARRMAEFNYRRLKGEFPRNSLPYFSLLSPVHQSASFEDFFREREQDRVLREVRKEKGRKKEVVIFVHGMGENRSCWADLPELIDDADFYEPDMDVYFNVYVWVYQTWAKSAGVELFSSDLEKFVDVVKKREGVEKVNLIAHSYGGPTCLRYMITKNAQTGRLNAESVERFIGIAPSLHGSSAANLAIDTFMPPPKKFQRRLPLFSNGMPLVGTKGDRQIIENAWGSTMNIVSFSRFDRITADFGGEQRGPKCLTIIGDPFWFNLVDPKVPPWILIPPKIGRIGTDQLVETFSANLNHIFLSGSAPPFENVGFDRSEVRLDSKKHFASIAVKSRKNHVYRYVLSFLRDELIPQIDPGKMVPRRFLAVVRAAPAWTDKVKAEDLPSWAKKHGVFFRRRRLADETRKRSLPPLKVEITGEVPARICSRQWNNWAGTYLIGGKMKKGVEAASMPLRISAEGYKTVEIALPVKPNQVTYLVDLKLELDE
jgi:pimeloyl-ACP methyl ester carboxylesterase